jgi:hypothetical protein
MLVMPNAATALTSQAWVGKCEFKRHPMRYYPYPPISFCSDLEVSSVQHELAFTLCASANSTTWRKPLWVAAPEPRQRKQLSIRLEHAGTVRSCLDAVSEI